MATNHLVIQTPAAPTRKPAIESASPAWPSIFGLGLSADQILARRQGVGGSDANIILSGDAGRLRQLWLEKRGEVVPPDLLNNLAVALGSWTESFNRQWYEKIIGQSVDELGVSLVYAKHAWRR